ncbi:zinc ABC transporter substrate-binding protein ZnuA [Stappia sp. F7233]|uniref:High-affinity zinc uptake system protein ZnuA n=1 Tax=Stappia albiluteola TaxID=2758565 RepID=A0A839AED0_9HYPH|nr:zinc ABC transporter substrate-binding protein ZnuA [Stappia albiluteola]MBA5777167.1 zinc ABC transporter substrate-binding protein ZnuA [Stappia albiluteola]
MKPARLLSAATLFLTMTAGVASADAPNVVVSIKPLHSLVAGVMQGVGTPGLIVDGAGSPHSYSLKPSQAEDLQNASLIFWGGPDLEAFLSKPLETLGAGATVISFEEVDGLERLQLREGGAFEEHLHDEEEGDHDGHEAHHDEHHDHEEIDMHLWLDPVNAKAFVAKAAAALSVADPANGDTYKKNAADLEARLDDLVKAIDGEVAPVRSRPFIVFHDAYQYFEKRFGLAAAGSITVNPEVNPGAQRLAEIQEKVAEAGAVCIFAEPQFEPKFVAIVAEGSGAKSGVLDPLGAAIPAGPNHYFDMMRALAASLKECLSQG